MRAWMLIVGALALAGCQAKPSVSSRVGDPGPDVRVTVRKLGPTGLTSTGSRAMRGNVSGENLVVGTRSPASDDDVLREDEAPRPRRKVRPRPKPRPRVERESEERPEKREKKEKPDKKEKSFEDLTPEERRRLVEGG